MLFSTNEMDVKQDFVYVSDKIKKELETTKYNLAQLDILVINNTNISAHIEVSIHCVYLF